MQELASSHLEKAIGVDGSSEKDYHIRSALQALVFAEEDRPD